MDILPFPVPERDLGLEAQRAAEQHLAACQEAMFAFEEGGEEIASPAIAPFCGCETCVIREVLHAAWEILEKAARSGHLPALPGCPEPPAELAGQPLPHAIPARHRDARRRRRPRPSALDWASDLR